MDAGLRVTNLREFVRAADAAGKATKKQVRDRLRKVADVVREDTSRRLARFDAGSAAGVGVSVRRAGSLTVEQRHPKTTGRRPFYGGVQMRHAFEPALEANAAQIDSEMDQAIEEIADIFERSY